jgi:hypothetical protein
VNVCLFCSDSYFDAARRGQCVNSVARRMSGAHAPRGAIPHVAAGMRACALRPSGSVWLATPGRDERTTRTQIRARVGCRARTHALAGGVQMGRRGFLFAALRAASSLPGTRPHFWRRTGGRRVYDRTQTVAAACNPLGATPIVSHGRKEGTVAVPTHASDVGWFP